MKILKIDVDAGKALVELDRSVVGKISNLMFQAKLTGEVRAHFYLLYELLSHGAFDGFALEMGHDILSGEINLREDNDGTA